MEILLIVTEFILIAVLEYIGIRLHILQKIIAIDKAHPELTRKEVIDTFHENDSFTIKVSYLVMALNLVAHFIIHVYAPALMDTIPYFIIWAFASAFVLGYAGQRLIYKILGTAESVINKKIESKNK